MTSRGEISGALSLLADRVRDAVGAAHVELDEARARLTVRPGSAAEMVDLLRVAREGGLTVGVGAPRGLSLDLQRMRSILHLDETSLLCQVQAGLTLVELEAAVQPRGLTVGALPATSRVRAIGALLAAPRPSEATPRLGRLVSACAGVQALLADGTELSTRVAPRKATGPDLQHALVGARGTLGLITAATLRLYRRGESRAEAGYGFATVEAALSAARAILVRGLRPVDLCVTAQPARLWLAVEGTGPHAAAERALAHTIAVEQGGREDDSAAPPQLTRSAYERAVPLERVHAAIPSQTGRVCGFHTHGAALVDPERGAEPKEAHPLLVALKRQLDPDGRLPAWSPAPDGN